MQEFKNKVLIIGYGSVGRCTLPLLLKHISITFQNITIIDCIDQSIELKTWIRKGIKFYQKRISPLNMVQELSKYVSSGGLIIDLSWNIECEGMLEWCYENNVLYVNASVEEWDPYAEIHNKTLMQKSIYNRYVLLKKTVAKWSHSNTSVIDHGANPGLISHFVKKAILDIAAKAIEDKMTAKKEANNLDRLMQKKDFARLSMKLGIKVIHISERDTQVSNISKALDEFVGTWSIEGLREEAISAVEMGWGTHEHELPSLATVPDFGPKNQIFLPQMGMNTWVRTWIPYQEIVGMVIRHGEAFTISDKLTVTGKGKALYRPTVHYAYMPSFETLSSLYELRCRNYELQPKQRIMGDDIVAGDDTLGALLMGHKYNSWWTGSVLNIKEARKLIPHQNATTLQVAIGVVSAIMWMIDNPRRGVCFPEDLPYDYILNIAKPYLGEFISQPSEWTPFKNYQVFFKENSAAYLNKNNPWCFNNFLFKD